MLLRVGFTDPIPRSCYFPSDLNHVCQLLNMDMLKKSGLRTAQENSDCEFKWQDSDKVNVSFISPGAVA